jgi:hypothetical protein
MRRKIKLGEQLSAIGVVRRILVGSEKAPTEEKQRAYLVECLDATESLPRIARDNEAAFRGLILSIKAGAPQK